MSTAWPARAPSNDEILHLLVIDDSALELELTTTTIAAGLPHAGIEALRDPEAALDAVRSGAFDCVFIDYNMPQLDGIELGRRIRAEFTHLPLVLMTAVGYDTLVAEAIRSGFTDYIPKDKISPTSARRTINRAVQVATQARLIEEQRQELEHFAYALAHDFKQPIRQIRVFADLLNTELGAQASEDATKHLAFLSEASRRLATLVDVMSQYTLLNKPPELGVLDLNEAVRSVRQNLEGFIVERRATLLADANVSVLGNEALLTQVLQNLVVNGLRYNRDERPHVSIRTELSGEGRRRVIVTDNGIGIESRYHEQIFQPLMRLHNVSEFPGTGLGLTITRKAVLAQGGRIWCRSEPGEGSSFIVELDAAPGAAPARAHNT